MDKKKLAAAVAAVTAYIKTSEEASAAYASQFAGQPLEAAAAQTTTFVQANNVWGMSGRQSHMQANTMMQLRMFK
jgi:hypothetical protein